MIQSHPSQLGLESVRIGLHIVDDDHRSDQ
jgi:hypothetical protein